MAAYPDPVQEILDRIANGVSLPYAYITISGPVANFPTSNGKISTSDVSVGSS